MKPRFAAPPLAKIRTAVTALATTVATTLAIAPAAHADTFQPYGSVDGWNVFIDTDKKSCLIETMDSAGNVVQMGLTRDRGVGYLGVFTKAETDIKSGDKKGVAVLLGDNLYIGQATMMRGNITKGYSGGYILTDDPQLVEDIAQQYEMIVFPETDWVFRIDLTGTKKAIEAARACNAKQVN